MKKTTRIKSFFFRQIFLSFFLTTAILALLVTLLITAVYNNAIKNTVYRFNQKLLAQSNYSVLYIDELALRVTNSLNQDRNVIGFLYADQHSPKEMMYLNQAVQQKIFSLTYINSVYLYNGAQDLIYSSKTGEQTTTKKFYNQALVDLLGQHDQLKELQGRPFANNTHSKEDSPNVYSYVLPVWNTVDDSLKSALIINIGVESLTNTIGAINQADDDFGSQFLVVNQKGLILGTPPKLEHNIANALIEKTTPTQSILLPEIQKRIQSEDTAYFTYRVNGEKYLVMYSELIKNDWLLVGLFLEKDLFQDVTNTSYLSLVILFLLFFACILFGLYNAQRISQPLQSISQKIKNSLNPIDSKDSDDMTEIELIQSVFGNMEEQNKQFETLRQESSYALKQELLSGLVSGSNMHTMSKVIERLDFLDLSFIHQSPLRILALQIDDYQNFQHRYSPRERWAYRYAITNLASEIANEYVQNVVFSQNHDTFVVLLSDTNASKTDSLKTVQPLLEKIQNDFQTYLELSVSIAFSEPFEHLIHLSREYETLCDLLQLRIKYGYGMILDPSLLDELEYDALEVPLQKEAPLFLAINRADQKTATGLLRELLTSILPYSYDEIIYYINHLAYAINEDIISKNMDSRIEIHEVFQTLLASLPESEILSQTQTLFEEYIGQLCVIVSQKQDTKNTMQIMTGRILELIEERYTDQNLSLNTIANQLDLSPKYVGRVFRETAGTSVSRYLLEFRLDLVGKSIRNNEYDGADTLEKVGLEFNNYFYTLFKNHFGVTLNEYRAQYSPENK